LLINLTSISPKDDNNVCLDPSGNEVDWYMILLFPKSSEKSGTLSYGYYDNSATSLKYYTYDKKTFPAIDFTYMNSFTKKLTNVIFWNDDRSTEGKKEGSPDSKGHSKGGLIYNKTSGRYIMHSLPRFPRRSDDGIIVSDLPDNAGLYGQHFLCISLHTNEVLKLIEHLIIINPSIVYTHGGTDNVGLNTEQVEKLLSGKADRSRDSIGSLTLKSKQGKEFDLFSKGSASPDIPFDAIIPNTYKSSIYVETWTKPKLLDTICDAKYKVMNVIDLQFGKHQYNSNNEHSKWAVLEKKPVSCFSDLNRVAKQKERGGLTICVSDTNLANIMRKSIVSSDDCKSKKIFELAFLQDRY